MLQPSEWSRLMWSRTMLMYSLVQIDLPPYTDYASLEQKLTLAVECVSIPTHCFTFIYPIVFAGRLLALVKNKEYLAYLAPFGPYPLSHSDARLPSHVFRACFQCLPRLPLVSCDPRLHDASISLLISQFGSARLLQHVSWITSYLQPKLKFSRL